MATRMIVAALVAALLAVTGAAFAQTPKKDCPQPSASPGAAASSAAKAPERIEGEITKIDKSTGQVTMRLSDGSMQQFNASKETLDDLKVGDRIEAKKRDC